MIDKEIKEASENYGKKVLDERKNKKYSLNELIWISGSSVIGFQKGAKWQQENISNSIEQVIKDICKDNTHLLDTPEIQEIIKYFKQQNK